SISDHNYSFGRYYAHAYLLLGNSQMVGVGASSLQMDQPVNVTKIQATYQGMGNYSLIMSPVLTTGRVKFAIWSEVDGQDDIRWYDAYRQ
ncbi:GBS Bsp-like repeat-containing protein, partial [Streptococcus pyogenes]